jgi:hypothetical protein
MPCLKCYDKGYTGFTYRCPILPGIYHWCDCPAAEAWRKRVGENIDADSPKAEEIRKKYYEESGIPCLSS